MDLPSGELVNLFEQLSFIRVVEMSNQAPVMLFHATLLNNRSMKEVDSIPEVQVMDVLHIDGKEVLFTARMSGPIARLISGKKDAWPIPPILIEKKQLVLSMQGTPRGLSNFLQEIKQLIGSRFTLTVNKAYQGEWLTAPNMSCLLYTSPSPRD